MSENETNTKENEEQGKLVSSPGGQSAGALAEPDVDIATIRLPAWSSRRSRVQVVHDPRMR
jgi:hypothetical protein